MKRTYLILFAVSLEPVAFNRSLRRVRVRRSWRLNTFPLQSENVHQTARTPVAAYEKRLAMLETEKLEAEKKLAKGVRPKHSLDELFERFCQFLANPWKLWDSGNTFLRRKVLKLAFTDRIEHCRQIGIRTPETALLCKVLGGFEG